MKNNKLEMEEVKRRKENIQEKNTSQKEVWEAPKLYSLDKSNTETGSMFPAATEELSYTSPAS